MPLQKFFTAKPTGSEKKEPNPRAEFYAKYKQEAEHADKDSKKKCAKGLNARLILVCSPIYMSLPSSLLGVTGRSFLGGNFWSRPQRPRWCRGGAAALLRVLIYKMDGTAFGDQAPPLQAWDGPNHDAIICQAVLYTGLGVSLLAAFFATLGKQWLNLFGKAKVRSFEIDESRNRQRKPSGMVSWKFDLVMEGLPLMLQSTLLLLGYALSRYLWTINLTIASVVIGITSIGLAFYTFIVIAATIADNCPFQNPASQIPRFLYRLDNSRNRYIARCRRAVSRL